MPYSDLSAEALLLVKTPHRGKRQEQESRRSPLKAQRATGARERQWCPRSESNRHAIASGGFSSYFGFRRRRASAAFVVWSTPSPWPCGFRCPPSALYTFPDFSGLGSALARICPGPSPSLTGFAFGLSPERLKFQLLESTASTSSATGALGHIYPKIILPLIPEAGRRAPLLRLARLEALGHIGGEVRCSP